MQSQVLSCGAQECAYNENKECHAPSISVGDDHPQCDTFTRSAVPAEAAMPAVAACQISDCQFNSDLNCQAPGITVWNHEQHADCATFLPLS